MQGWRLRQGILLFDILVAERLPGVDFSWDKGRIRPLTAQTLLLFVSVFLDFYIFSAAKYAIDTCMDDKASGYFNIIFMPTSVINLAAGFVIRPVLTDLTGRWNRGQVREFAGRLLGISRIIGALGLLAVVLAAGLGQPVLWVLEQVLGSGYEEALPAIISPLS